MFFVQGAVENGEKLEETGCEIICGAPTTLAVKGLVKVVKVSQTKTFGLSLIHI